MRTEELWPMLAAATFAIGLLLGGSLAKNYVEWQQTQRERQLLDQIDELAELRY